MQKLALRLWFLMSATVIAAATPVSATSYDQSCNFEDSSDALSLRCEAVLQNFVARWLGFRDGTLRAARGDSMLAPSTYHVVVQGHADRAEDRRALAAVGARRARAVAEWIIAAGVPSDLVSAEGYGATCLLVPSDPGQAEPQNRRVELFMIDGSRRLLPCGRSGRPSE